MLVLLMTAVTGAWATITVTINQSDWGESGNSFTKDGVTVSATMIIRDNFMLFNGGTFSTTLGNFTKIVVTAEDTGNHTGWNDGTWTGTPASTVSFDEIFGGVTTIVCTIEPATVAASTYTVTLKEGTEDATSWTIAPPEATTTGVAQGTEVTASYGGVKKVKSVKAKKKAAAPAEETVTWDNTNVFVSGNSSVTVNKDNPYTYGGVSISFSGDSWLQLYNSGQNVTKLMVFEDDVCTFTAPSGKKFTKIEITDNSFATFTAYGDWTMDGDKTAIWSGTASNTVTLGSSNSSFFTNLKSIVFTMEEAAAPAAAEGHPLSASEVGEIVCSDGLAYAAADKDNLPTGVTAVAIVAYLGDGDTSDNTYNNGLAIAMTNANDGSGCGWGDYFVSYNCVSKSNDIATAIGFKDGISSTNTLTSDGHYHEAATAAVSNNGTAAPTGTSGWFLPSIGQWNLIVQGLASKKAGSAVTTDISTSGNDTYTASNLNSVITDAGGTGFNSDSGYQSSTQYDSDDCWHMEISSGRASNYVFYAGDYVRSVLAF